MSNTIKIAEIDDTGRIRPVDKDHAALIAASIEESGRVENPIVVRPVDGGDKPYRLTTGAHRLEAFRMLGLDELTIGEHVVVREQDDVEAQFSEIDENLARAELNPLDRAMFMAARKRLYVEAQRTRARGGDRKSNKFNAEIKSQTLGFDFSERFSANAAKRLGLSEETIRLAVRIAEKIDREAAAAIRGTLIETNQQELLAFIAQSPEDQRSAATLLQAGEARTVRQARIALKLDVKPTDDLQAATLAKVTVLIEKASPGVKAKIADLLWPLLDAKTRKKIFDKYETF